MGMRLALLFLLFMVVGFVAGREWKKAGREMSFSVPETATPVASPQGGQAGRLSSPFPTRQDARIIVQEKQVANLQKQVDEKREVLAALDKQRNGAELSMSGGGQGGVDAGSAAAGQTAQASPQDVQNQLNDARATLQALQAQRQNAVEQQNRSVLTAQAGQEVQRLDTEISASQLRDEITRAQATARDLNVRLQEQRANNLNTDEQARLEVEAPEAEQRVADLQAQYRDLQLSFANQDASSRLEASEAGASAANSAALLGDQIRQQQVVVNKLEQSYLDSQNRQQAGISARESLNERYLEQKREYGELSRDLDAQKQVLAQLKNPGAG